MTTLLGILCVVCVAGDEPTARSVDLAAAVSASREPTRAATAHREAPNDPWLPGDPSRVAGTLQHCEPWVRGPYVSVQVNVDAEGCNTPGDAANEPSMAIDPTNPDRIVIGWRQFDTVKSDFRQAGWGYSHDAGATWTFPGVLQAKVFRSDPVLGADAEGNIYFLSLRVEGPSYWCDLWKSSDGGMTWGMPDFAYGGDKAWFTIDTWNTPGHGNIYVAWGYAASCCEDRIFTRSTDGGVVFEAPQTLPGLPAGGTMAVDPDGSLYVSGRGGRVLKSFDAWDKNLTPGFVDLGDVDWGGLEHNSWMEGPNPAGALGQPWIACDHSSGSSRGYVYLLSSVWLGAGADPFDIIFARSPNGGETWSPRVRVNDDPALTGAWQWFGTMSVAPNGRIDVVWNDTRNSMAAQWSELYYASSVDFGRTWSGNIPVSPMFDSWVGWPNQNKIGDYYHSISDVGGVNVAYAATFNGEQDVYFLRIPADCNENGLADLEEVLGKPALDANDNMIPDECETDTDGDSLLDADDIDIDSDGVANPADACPLGPVGVRARTSGSPYGDLDEDCTVGLDDLQRIHSFGCFENSGPGLPSPGRICGGAVDFDADGDVDLGDFAAFQRAFWISGV